MADVNRGVLFQQIDRLYREGTLSGLGDGQLLERYLTHGDEAAFEALVNLHGPMVLGLCRRVLRDPRDIEDAFQATFLILVRKASTIRDRRHLSNWLFGVAYRVARRARTNTLRRRDREIAVENLEASAAPETADILGIGPVLDQELNRLPLKYRAPLILCYLKGHTHDRAAEELECPVGTVRSRLARGRELLRRRLTSRGHVPTAAFLGADASLPVSLLTEAVPPSLLSETVEAALRIGASKTIQAGAVSASVVALTQGVLTTMKSAQLTLLGIAILATSLSAGSVIAFSYAAVQDSKGARDGLIAAANSLAQSDARKDAEKETPAPSAEKRLRALEVKVDELSRSNVAAAKGTQNAEDPFRRATTANTPDDESGKAIYRSRGSIRELEVELHLAIADEARSQLLFERASISTMERDQSRGRVLLVKAKLDGLDDELTDDLDRLKLEIRKKRAELDQAEAQKEVAISVVLRSRGARAPTDTPPASGTVPDFEVVKAEGELKACAAQVEVKRAEFEAVELRSQQLERRRHQIQQVIKLAGVLQKPNLPTRPAASPGTPAPRR